MKATLLTLISLFSLTQLFAQKFEVSIQANSGLYHYDGKASASVSFINQGSTDKGNYTNNPYGSKNGFSYGGDIQGQYVSKCGFITGLQAGYEVLRSKVDINGYYPSTIYLFNSNYIAQSYQIPVKGQSFLQNQDININPYIGYRLQTKKIKIDMMPGIDLGFNVSSYDKGKAIDSTGNTYRTNLKKLDAPTDVRLRFGVAATYKRFGITAAYAHGLTNIAKNLSSDSSYEIHSELLRFGITYRIL
jgi:hypothetical protein